MSEEQDVQEGLTNPDVVTKYRKAAEICNQALQHVQKLAVAGAKIVDLCVAGDTFITEQTSKIYTKGKGDKKVEKGVAFPTCVSPNNVVGTFSPLLGDATELKEGDLVKIDLGVHVDGYAAVAAQTIVVGGAKPAGRQADVLAAVATAADVIIRMLRPGTKNSEITEMIGKVAADFKCSAVQGVLSHEMTRNVIDGKKVIIQRPEPDHKVDEFEIGTNEVYAIDIVFSTGDGKPKESEDRTTVFKRAQESNYQLKMKASRAVFSDIIKKFPTFPFTLRNMEEKTARFGIKECRDHGLVHAYPVLVEKEGELVAHLKFTALVLPTGTVQISGFPVDRSQFPSECKVSEDVAKILSQSKSGGAAKKKNKKKKAGDKPAAEEAA